MEKWILEAALIGLEQQMVGLRSKVDMVYKMLAPTHERPAVKCAPKPKRKKRNLSPEARKRIADAQRKRWDAYRKDTSVNG